MTRAKEKSIATLAASAKNVGVEQSLIQAVQLAISVPTPKRSEFCSVALDYFEEDLKSRLADTLQRLPVYHLMLAALNLTRAKVDDAQVIVDDGAKAMQSLEDAVYHLEAVERREKQIQLRHMADSKRVFEALDLALEEQADQRALAPPELRVLPPDLPDPVQAPLMDD